jgi:hypothetical protein
MLRVHQRSESEASIGRREYHRSDDRREHFEYPGEVVVRTDYRPDENGEDNDREREERAALGKLSTPFLLKPLNYEVEVIFER